MKAELYIMVLDPNSGVRDDLNKWIADEGHRATALENEDSALKIINERNWDMIILNAELGHTPADEVIQKISERLPRVPIFVISKNLTSEKFNAATRSLVAGFIGYPVNKTEVRAAIRKIAEWRLCEKENQLLKQRLDGLFSLHPIVGKSDVVMALREKLRNFAEDDGCVFIVGELGTGKEHFAKTIHSMSRRRYMPFETVSLGFFSDAQVESEIFGHEKSAFTGSAFIKKGKLELAGYGTIYMDEISELELDFQAKFEKAIDRKEFRRVDGTSNIKIDVRPMISSRYTPDELLKEGQIREKLHRLFTKNIFQVPPLRERPEDIPLLADHFLQIFSSRINKKIKRISPRALRFLTDYSWPGNIRELQNAIERAVILGRHESVDVENLPHSIRGYLGSPESKSIKEWEKYHIKRVLEENNWNISRSAVDLDIDRVTLYNKIKKYKLTKLSEETGA